MTKRVNYKDDLGREPLDNEKEDMKLLLNKRRTILHLPEELLDPDSEWEYGMQAYMCGGQDAESFHTIEDHGWRVVHESELPEGVKFYSGNEVAYEGRKTQDGYHRRGGQIVVRRKKWAREQVKAHDEAKLNEYKAKVEQHHVFDKGEMEGPYLRDHLLQRMRMMNMNKR